MYRHLLQRNAILNAADHMSAVNAITIHNFKLRLAYYRCALIEPFSMCLLPFFCVHLSPTPNRCLFTYCIIGTIGTRHYTVHLRTIYGLEPWIRFGTIFFMRSSLRKGMVSSWLWWLFINQSQVPQHVCRTQAKITLITVYHHTFRICVSYQ